MVKIFRVVTERDGETTAVPGTGKRSTEIERMDHRYAAETITEVWDAIDWLRNDQEQTVIAIIEEHPAITILGKE
jgi:hypothetical protein